MQGYDAAQQQQLQEHGFLKALPSSCCSVLVKPSVTSRQLQEYLWNPARLHAFLETANDESSSTSTCTAGVKAAGTCQLKSLARAGSDQAVPQHLRQLLLLLLQGAADTGHAQELIWTPHRLSKFLSSELEPQEPSSSLTHGYVAADAEQTMPQPATGLKQLPSYVQLLPLVSSVVAARAEQGPASNKSSNSDGSGTSLTCVPEQEAPQPGSSSDHDETMFCIEVLPQAASDEVTSPRKHHQQQCVASTQDHGLQLDRHSQVPQQQQQQPHVLPCQQQSQEGQGQQQQLQCAPAQQRLAHLQHQTQQQQPQLLPMLRQLQLLHQVTAAMTQAQRQLQPAAGPASVASGMPRKEALPGDYPVVDVNTAWSAAALIDAAATAACTLGLPPTSSLADASAGSTDNSSSDVQASCDASAQQRAKTAQAPRFGVLMLVHEKGVTAAEVWEAWEGAHSGKAVVRVHLKEGVSTAGVPGEAWVSSRQLPSRICSKWGCISLTAAILQAAADMLQQHPQLQHIALVSGQDVPVCAVPRDLRPGLSLFGRFQFGKAFDEAACQVACDVLQQRLGMSRQDSKAWGEALVFHHTWMVLDRQLLLALISKQEELLRVGTVLNERFMHPDVAVAADEFILITAAMRYGFVKQVVQRKLQTHMTAVRRQHRQHVAATAGQLHPIDEDATASADGGRPAKEQRLGSVGADACMEGPAEQAAARQGDCRPSSSGSSRMDNANTGATSGKPQDSSRGSSVSRADAQGGPLNDLASAQPSRSTDDSSAEPGPSGRRSHRREQAAGAAGIPPEQLVGRRIRVWWQMDEAFYCGVVTYYSLSTKRHTVKYDDGDVEIINLAKETWKLEGNPAPAPAASNKPSVRRSGSTGPAPTSSAGAACSPLHEGTFGVLLDCCPTLALFHPTQTRHPQEWRNFSECLLVDVHSHRPGNNRLTLLDALGLAQPNSALFFRKVAQMQRQGPAQLLGCLKLLWKNKQLPALIEELSMD